MEEFSAKFDSLESEKGKLGLKSGTDNEKIFA